MAAFIAFAVGCSAAPGSEVQIAEGSAEFSQGDLVVKLDANPTTGYEWTFQIDGSAVQPDGDEFVPASDGAQPKTGEGGVHTFNFKADGSGEATLTFTYARSWEASDSDKTVVLHATVENGAFTQVEEQASFLVRNALDAEVAPIEGRNRHGEQRHRANGQRDRAADG